MSVAEPSSSSQKKTYMRTCKHCDEPFRTTSPTLQYKPGHHPNTPSGWKPPPTAEQLSVIERTIPETCRVPTVYEALSKRPEACQKCGSSSIQEALVDELVRMGNGRGVGWCCLMCGWQMVAFAGTTKLSGAGKRKRIEQGGIL